MDIRTFLCLIALVVTHVKSQGLCDTVYGFCANVQSLSRLQSCVNAAASCNSTSREVLSFCATCRGAPAATAVDFNLANPAVARCIYDIAHRCLKNVNVGQDEFTCTPPEGTVTPCRDMFAEYSTPSALTASNEYSQCVSVANANCLGLQGHAWCAAGGTSQSSDPLEFLGNLQSACNFPYRAFHGIFVLPESSVANMSTVGEVLIHDLITFTGVQTTIENPVFILVNVTELAPNTVITLDLMTGGNKSPGEIVGFLSSIFSNSEWKRGNVTRFVTSMSFSQNFPFSSDGGTTLSAAQRGGIVAGVLIFIAFLLIVYQIYAHHSKRGEESDSDEDEEDDKVIHQRNQQRYIAAQKQQPEQVASGNSHGQHHSGSVHPLQNKDEAIAQWS